MPTCTFSAVKTSRSLANSTSPDILPVSSFFGQSFQKKKKKKLTGKERDSAERKEEHLKMF